MQWKGRQIPFNIFNGISFKLSLKNEYLLHFAGGGGSNEIYTFTLLATLSTNFKMSTQFINSQLSPNVHADNFNCKLI